MPFGFSLGGNKSKTKTKSSGTFNNTTTPILPDWVTSPVSAAAGRVNDLFGLDPRGLAAPADPLQIQAGHSAAGLSGSPWNFDAAADLMRGAAAAGPSTYAASTWTMPPLGAANQAQAQSALEGLDAYMSPYRRDVVDAALRDFDFGAGRSRAQLDLDLAGAGAFGGSGAALARSLSEDALVRGRAKTSADLLDQAWQRGAALSSADADRRQQAAIANAAALNQFALQNAQLAQEGGLSNTQAQNEAGRFNAAAQAAALQRQMEAARGLADISSAFDANRRGNIQTQASIGDTLRGIDEDLRQAPVTSTQQIVAMLTGLPFSLFSGKNEQGVESKTSTTKEKGVNGSLNGSVTFLK
jgi:hypothetical protein